jgi:hypothetical protein
VKTGAHARIGVIAGLVWLLLLLAGLQPAYAASEDDAWQHLPYQLGQGLYFPHQGLRVGGYSSIHYFDVEEEPATLNVNDLSLFLTKELSPRWKLFSEMEVGDALTITTDGADSHDAEFDVERLYADYHARPWATLRLGRFLTPVGQWNLIHADPLVWTVSRPLTTSAAFAHHATGAMLHGTLAPDRNDLDYWLFVDDSRGLTPSQPREPAFSDDGATSTLENNFNRAAGGRLLYHLSNNRVSLGVSYLGFQLEKPQRNYRLAGLDFSWSTAHADLSGEAVYRTTGDSGETDEHGGFIQAVVPLTGRLYLVGR